MFSYKDKQRKIELNKIKNNKKIKPLQVRTLANTFFQKVCWNKSALHIISNNQGNAVIEATLTMPIFIFLFITIFSFGKIIILEQDKYFEMMSTARDMAYYTSSELLDSDGYVELHSYYSKEINIPFINVYGILTPLQVRQKAFVGYFYEDEKVKYVYVAENGQVYHNSRSCTHIKLGIKEVSKNSLHNTNSKYISCKICGDESNYSEKVYITTSGDCYHYFSGCSGLKRSVSRVKLEYTSGLRECSRCGK